ncbi:MAG: DUF1592 domain-containing protein [Planctomycetota bacterium]
MRHPKVTEIVRRGRAPQRTAFAAAALAALVGVSPSQQATFGAAADVVQQSCVDCHGKEKQKGDLDLTAAPTSPLDRLLLLRRVRDRVAAGEMPPPDVERLDDAPRALLLRHCADTLAAEVPKLPAAPGRVTIRRLSRAEWEYTVFDLFGVRSELTDLFPADDLGYGFDNIGDALSFSTLHLEKYMAAAADVAAQVFSGVDPKRPTVRRREAERMELSGGPGVHQEGEVAGFIVNAALSTTVRLPRDGDYRLRLSAGADQAGDEPARLRVSVDGTQVAVLDVAKPELATLEVATPMARGERVVEIAFVNDFFDPENPDPKRRDRNLRVDWLEVVGPVDVQPPPQQQEWIGTVHESRLGRMAVTLARRIWREPVRGPDLKHVVAVGLGAIEDGAPDHEAAAAMLTALLSSPRFLFRSEAPPARSKEGDVTDVADPALAVRLGYFVWSSAPDDTLLSLAQKGRLGNEKVLRQQVRRMLADPRAERLATNFGSQWLELRALQERQPDPQLFPDFDDALRASLRRETELLFAAVLREDLDVRRLLDADFTHVDRRLARFYGLDGAFGDEFTRTKLPPAMADRGGVLGHASVHVVTSNPTRTSPVKRGKWVLQNLLGQPPPPPPPGNDSFADERDARTPRGLRAQLAAHRDRAECVGCHLRMDALGLMLEHYDPIGRPRREVDGEPVDASGELPDGRRVEGLPGLKELLLHDPSFPRALARKLFVYGVGREPAALDVLQLDLAVDGLLAAGKVTIADLVEAVAVSPGFRMLEVEK